MSKKANAPVVYSHDDRGADTDSEGSPDGETTNTASADVPAIANTAETNTADTAAIADTAETIVPDGRRDSRGSAGGVTNTAETAETSVQDSRRDSRGPVEEGVTEDTKASL